MDYILLYLYHFLNNNLYHTVKLAFFQKKCKIEDIQSSQLPNRLKIRSAWFQSKFETTQSIFLTMRQEAIDKYQI